MELKQYKNCVIFILKKRVNFVVLKANMCKTKRLAVFNQEKYNMNDNFEFILFNDMKRLESVTKIEN